MGNKNSSNEQGLDGQGQKKKGAMKVAKEGYNELVKAIIRPPRADYTDAMLGPKRFTVRGNRFIRKDLKLTNKRDLQIHCSHWLPENQDSPIPCVIYLHGNSSCRLESLDCLRTLLAQGLSLFAFDFAGSGKSDGEYISLGWYERDDVKTVVEYLRDCKLTSSIGLWGRSMGAATALMYAKEDPSLGCIVCDSPFASLPRLARELVESTQVQVPKFAVTIALRMIRSSVQSRAKFDINKIKPINFCETAQIPALFGAAEDDTFISPEHAKALHEKYAGDKNIVMFSGSHNTKRERFFHTTVAIFLHETLIKPLGGSKEAYNVESEEIGDDFISYNMPNPLATQGPRDTIETDTDVALAKTALIDEEEAMLQQAIALSLAESAKQP